MKFQVVEKFFQLNYTGQRKERREKKERKKGEKKSQSLSHDSHPMYEISCRGESQYVSAEMFKKTDSRTYLSDMFNKYLCNI